MAEITFGSDPEAFFVNKNKQVVGSETLIPITGLSFGKAGSIAVDGVQFELHPNPGSPAELKANTREILLATMDYAESKGCEISFVQFYSLTEKFIRSLSENASRLGCMPSLNVYRNSVMQHNPATYYGRSAGGHIHYGLPDKYKEQAPRAVYVQDILLGYLAGALEDRIAAAYRRQMYGKAGEFRLPKYGLEYRTLSNFWLRDPVLMDVVLQLAELAIDVYTRAVDGNSDRWDRLAGYVNIGYIQQYVNTGNALTMDGLNDPIARVITDWLPADGPTLNRTNIKKFMKWAKNVKPGWETTTFPTTNIRQRWLDNNDTFSDFLERVTK